MFFEIEEVELGQMADPPVLIGKAMVFVPSIEIVRPIEGESELGPLVEVTFQSGRKIRAKNFIRKPPDVAFAHAGPDFLGGLHS